MDGKRLILSVFFFLLAKFAFGQSISYTYTDPCTGVQNTVTVSSQSGTVVMFYAGNYQVFTMSQLQSGGYEAWVASVNAAAPPGSNPCAGNAGAVSGSTSASVGTNVTNTVTNVTGALSVLGGTTTTTSGGMDVSSSTSSSSNSNSSSNEQGNSSSSDDGDSDSGSSSSGSSSNDGSSSGSTSSDSGSSGSALVAVLVVLLIRAETQEVVQVGIQEEAQAQVDHLQAQVSSSSGSTGGSSSSGSGSGGGTSSNTEGSGGVDGTGTGTDGGGDSNSGGAVGDKSIESSSGGQSDSDSESDSGGSGGGKKKKNGPRARKGSLIASGDMVVVRNGSDYKQGGNDNLKLNAGMTYANTNQTLAAGALLNYTTGQNEFALTGYGSLKIEESMLVGSNSFLYNAKQETWFNTGNFMYAFKQTSYMTVLFGTNFSLGKLGEENFSNWSAQVGVFTTFNGYKGVAVNLMGIGMYSPYTFFYEGQWFKGGFLLVPLTSFDFSVTDTFKLNISTSTVMLQGQGILNFQLMTGTKMLL
jgi:hypothetical protein